MKIKFWRENKTDQLFELEAPALKAEFKKWLLRQSKIFRDSFNSERLIRFFITDKKGLNSVFDEGDFDNIYNICRPVLLEL
jgi:hypothetical protein